MAVLFAVVPDEVKKKLSSLTPSSFDTFLRLFLRSAEASLPIECNEEGLPQFSVMALIATSVASVQGLVVALLSK
jgi:hypothetical protein